VRISKRNPMINPNASPSSPSRIHIPPTGSPRPSANDSHAAAPVPSSASGSSAPAPHRPNQDRDPSREALCASEASVHNELPPISSLARPHSPTFRHLRKAINKNWSIDEAGSWVTKPAKTRAMTSEEATAARMFKENMDLDDPARTKRREGEYGQIFERAGDKMVAGPLYYKEGCTIEFPNAAITERTAMTIHSHPYEPPPFINDFPSPNDYFSLYISSNCHTTRRKGDMMYHVDSDAFFWYRAKTSSRTGLPEFHALKSPTGLDAPRKITRMHTEMPILREERGPGSSEQASSSARKSLFGRMFGK
jgi:hypothetical protein